MFCLINIYAIEIRDEAKFFKRRFLSVWELKLSANYIKNLICNVRAFTTYSKIVNTSEKKKNVTIKDQTIDAYAMGGSVKTELWRKENRIDMFFPNTS